MGNKFGWHSGTLTAQNAKVKGDLYVQDDIVFSDVSAGTLGVTGGIDMQSTTSAIGIDMGGTFTTSAINIDGTCTHRALMIGTKDTGLTISTTGHTLDQEPANNYLFGLFSKVAATEATSSDELRSAWIRTRVNVNCDIGSNAGWGYGICGAEVQLKFYGGTTKVYAWQNSALWAQLESQAATTTFQSGSYTQCVLANIGLTSATLASGAVIAGVTINANTATLTNTGDAYYGLFITDKNTTSTNFTSGIWINDDVAVTGITVGNCTTGILLDGTYTTGINMVGGVSYNPIHIGVKHSTDPDYGLILTGATDDTGGIMVFCDDGGDALSSVTSPIWTRYLLTANHGANGETATGAFFQTKTKTGLTFTTGSYTALKAFFQVGGTLVTNNASTEVSIINAGISFEGNYTCTSGTLSGIDININDGTKTIGTHTGLIIRKTSSSTAGWTYGIQIPDLGASTGIYMVGGNAFVPILIGSKANETGSGVKLAGGTDDSGGVQIYADDGGAAAVGDVLSPIRSRYLLTVSQSGGKTQCGSFSQLRINDTLTMTNGGFRGAYIFNQIGSDLTLAGSAELVGINQATTILTGTHTVGASCRFAGIDINISGAGTISNSGKCGGLIIRSSGTPVWSNGILIEDSGAVTGIDIGTVSEYAINFSGDEGRIIMGTSTSARASFAATGDVVQFFTTNMASSGICTGLDFEHSIGYQGNTSMQATAVRGVLRILTGTTANSNKIYEGTSGYFKNEGTVNNAGLTTCGLRSCILDGGVYTSVSNVASLWVDSQLAQAVSSGDYSMILCTNNGATRATNMIKIYGAATYFMSLSGDNTDNWYAVTDTTSGAERGYLRLLVGDVVKRIKLYEDS